MADIPIDDGSHLPIGTLSDDGELVVGPQTDGNVGWCETPLGQHQRWMRSAPDLYEKYQDLLATTAQSPVASEATNAPSVSPVNDVETKP